MNRTRQAAGKGRPPRLNLIQIQDRYIDRLHSAFQRWSHRPKPLWGGAGGHYSRVRGAAVRQARRDLLRWGLTDEQARAAIKQADDIFELEQAVRLS